MYPTMILRSRYLTVAAAIRQPIPSARIAIDAQDQRESKHLDAEFNSFSAQFIKSNHRQEHQKLSDKIEQVHRDLAQRNDQSREINLSEQGAAAEKGGSDLAEAVGEKAPGNDA